MSWGAVGVVAVFGVATLPLVVGLRARNRTWGPAGAVWVVACGVLYWGAVRFGEAAVVAPVLDRPVEIVSAGYTGSGSCRACHPHNYDSWQASYHRTMTQVVTSESVIGDFGDVELEDGDFIYRFDRRGEELWVELDGPPASPGGPRRTAERRVVLSTGSHHQQVYWVSVQGGRSLGIFPFGHLVEQDRWVPLDSLFLKPIDDRRILAPGQWNNSCLRCHTTDSQPRPTTGIEMDTRVSEFGISCESCHGPAAEHVQANHDPSRRYAHHLGDEPDPTIVDPDKLEHDRSSEICAQCHAVTVRPIGEHEAWLSRGQSYRPGDELSATQTIVRYDALDEVRPFLRENPGFLGERFWSDGMIRVAGREYNGLIESGCFERGEISCLSCHRMHQPTGDPRPQREWTDDQLATEAHGDTACTGCHERLADNEQLTRHTHHATASSGSRCYNCHMPHTAYGLLKATRSHQIDSPTVQESLQAGRPNACNLCHLDQTLAWAADHLDEWYGTPRPELHPDEQSIAASLLWLLSGDAGQRALTAWSMGWEPARQASGTEWMTPYLGHLLDDPYAAVRYIAHRSLGAAQGYEEFEYDYVGPAEDRAAARLSVIGSWNGQRPNDRGNGMLVQQTFDRLRALRDDRPVRLAE